DAEWIAKLEFGQTPPCVLGWFSFWHGDFERSWDQWRQEMFEFNACCVIGIMVWGAAAVLLYALATSLFAAAANRAPYLSTPGARRRPRPRAARAIPEVLPVNGAQKVHVIPDVLPADGHDPGHADVPDAILLPDDGVRADRS